MAEDGSFPLETARTKPYGYSLFNLDAMATICQTLSDKNDNLWTYRQREVRIWRRVLILSIPMSLIRKLDLYERCNVLG